MKNKHKKAAPSSATRIHARTGSVKVSAGPISVSIPSNMVKGEISIKWFKYIFPIITFGGLGYLFYKTFSTNKSKLDIEKLKHKNKMEEWQYRDNRRQNPSTTIEDNHQCQPPIESNLEDEVYNNNEEPTNVFLGNTFVVRGSRNVIYGAKKSSKSSLATTIIQSIIMGDDYGLRFGLQGKTYSGTVKAIIYDAEMKSDDNHSRFSESGKHFYDTRMLRSFRYTVQQFTEDLKQRAMESDKDIIAVLDNGTKAFRGLNKDDADKLDNNIKEINEEMKKRGLALTFILIMHTTKDGKDMFGSSFIGNFFENIISIAKSQKIGRNQRIVTLEDCRHYEDGRSFIVVKDKNSMLFSYDLNKTKEMFPDDFDVCEEKQPTTEDAIREMLDWYKPNVEGHGWKGTYLKFGYKYFNSQSTFIRFMKKNG